MADESGDAYRAASPGIPPVYACINIYEDAKWLEMCLNSLEGKVKAVIVVDGAYEGFPHETPWSEDGTVELALERADVVVETKRAWPNEVTKRDYYLRYVPDGKWWLRIDADEELKGNFDAPLEGDCMMLMLQRDDGSDAYPIHALFRKHPDSRYFGTHHSVWRGDDLLIRREDWPVYSGASLISKTAPMLWT